MDGETIAFFGQAVGKMDEISAITKRAMAGELDFYESLKERVKFLKGVEVAKRNFSSCFLRWLSHSHRPRSKLAWL